MPLRPFCVLLLILLTFATTAKGQYSQLVVFGDSLSDTGNSFAATGIPPGGPGGFPYFEGRFCDGPNWIDFLQTDLNLSDAQVLNFAVGGSSTGFGFKAPPDGVFDAPTGTVIPTIGAQIETFLGVTAPNSEQLTILWAGANDLFAFTSPTAVVNNLELHVRDLSAAGADEFLIPSLPPLGSTPALKGTFEGFLLEYLSWRTNRLVKRRMSHLESELGIKVHRLDTYNLTILGMIFPNWFGLTNTTDAALEDIFAGVITPVEGASYLYWDIIHPTSKVHSVVAAAATTVLND